METNMHVYIYTLVERRHVNLVRAHLHRVDLGNMIGKLYKQFFFLFDHLCPERQVA